MAGILPDLPPSEWKAKPCASWQRMPFEMLGHLPDAALDRLLEVLGKIPLEVLQFPAEWDVEFKRKKTGRPRKPKLCWELDRLRKELGSEKEALAALAASRNIAVESIQRALHRERTKGR